MNFLFSLFLLKSLLGVLSQNIVQTPTSFPGFRQLSSYSIGEYIKDSNLNPSKDILYLASFYGGVIVLSIQNISSIIQFSELYRFKTAGHPLFIKSIDEENILVLSNTTNGQIIEVYGVTNSSAYHKASYALNQSDIRDMIVSNDSNYIYGVDYQYSLFILDITNRSKVKWIYQCNKTNMHSTHIVRSNNGTFVYYFVLFPNPYYKDSLVSGIQIVNVSNPRNISFVPHLLHYNIWNIAISGLTISESDFGIMAVCTTNYYDYQMWDYDLNQYMTINDNLEDARYCVTEIKQKIVIFRDNDFFMSGEKGSQYNLNLQFWGSYGYNQAIKFIHKFKINLVCHIRYTKSIYNLIPLQI